MANKKVNLNIETLDIEYELMKAELVELTNLYNESKTMLDNFKQGTKINTVFLATQTSNLISIREKILNIYKEMTGIKKSKMDFMLKENTANSKINDEASNNAALLKDIFGLIMGQNRSDIIPSPNIIDDQSTLPENVDPDLDFDKLLESRAEELNVSLTSENKEVEEIDDGLRIVVDRDRNLYVIDMDYNLIEDHRKNLDKIVIVDFINEDDPDNIKAIDNDGNEYEVIEFEED